MSMDLMASERVCYVHCNFCNTILAVSVPCNSLLNMVTVRCGHCANLLSVNAGASLQSNALLPQDPQLQKHHLSFEDSNKSSGSSSSSKCSKYGHPFEPVELHDQTRIPPIRRVIPPIRPPEKRQRVPSAYNRFIKEEIQRIKASNPDISHREAFSTAAKNEGVMTPSRKGGKLMSNTQAWLYSFLWAHFPHIHFGLKLDGSKQPKLDQTFAGGDQETQKSNGFY